MDSNEFKKRFNAQCQTDKFQSNIRSIIRHESFLKDLIHDLTFSVQVDKEIKSKLPSEIDRVATPIVESKINSFIYHKLPGIVVTQITAQLNNHNQIKDVVDKQTNNLKIELEATANNVMKKVVNEPKFNTLSKLHFEEIDQKNEIRIKNIEDNLSQKLKPMQDQLNYLEHRHKCLIMSYILLSLMGISGWFYQVNKRRD